ncbi:MAG: sugar ABC transporter permease [Spirochaetales bacterium]
MSKSIRKNTIDWGTSFAFVVPALVCYIMFVLFPITETFWISFHQWNGASKDMRWVGLDNYLEIFQDPIFYKALKNNIIWICFTICVPVLLGLIFSVMLTSKRVHFKFLYRLTYFMPNIVSLVAVGVIWTWIYNPVFGVIGSMFSWVNNGAGIDFLGDEKLVIWALVIAGSWTSYGFNMVVFLAALQNIDQSYLEVAEIEGANPFQRFFYVIIPLIKGTITLLVVNSLIGSFKVFDLIYIMTKGGPYHSSEVISTYMYNSAFRMNDYGYGAALAIVLAIIIAICSRLFLSRAEKGDK